MRQTDSLAPCLVAGAVIYKLWCSLSSASAWIKQGNYSLLTYISSAVKWLLGNNLPNFTFSPLDG